MNKGIVPLVCWLFISCFSQGPQIEEIGRETVESALLRKPEKTVFTASADSVSSVVVTDSTICVYYTKKQNKSFLVLKDMDGTVIGSPVHYGTEANQVLIANYSYGNGRHVVYDPLMKKAAVIEITKAKADSTYMPVFFNTDIVSQKVAWMDGLLLYLNPDAYDPSHSHVCLSDTQWNCRFSDKHSNSAFNATGGEILFNPSRELIAYCSRHEPLVEILDKNLHVLKQIWFPHQRGEVSRIQQEDGQELYLYKDLAPLCFPSADSNNDYLVTAFRTDDDFSVVVIMDWEGKVLDSFRTAADIERISLSQDGKFVYCWEIGEKESALKLYRLLT